MSWVNTTVGELIDVKHGYAFKSEYFSDSGDYVVLTPGNCYNEGGFKSKGDKEKWYVGDIPESYILNEGDLLLVMTDLVNTAPVLGGSFLIPDDDKYLHNQRLGLVQIKEPTKTNKRFLYYLFNTHKYRGQVRGSASGATVRHTAPERIKSCKVRIPSGYKEQKRIADVLSAYDDLIENNKRRIELLEESARQLYKEWFVRFRFPGHEHVKIINGVPEGWSKGCVREFGEVITGKTPSTKVDENYGGDIPFIKTPDMHGNTFVIQTGQSLTERGANTQPKKLIPANSVMVSCIGTIGVVSINAFPSHTNQQINSVIPKASEYRYFLFFALASLKARMEAMGGGATMANVNKAKFSGLPVFLPNNKLLESFHDVVEPVFLQIKTLASYNRQLAKARDLLLPKLMSGEIAV